MLVKYTENILREIKLPTDVARQVARRTLLSLVAPGEYLIKREDVVWLAQDDPGHRHGSVRTDYIRPATALDTSVFEVIKALY